MPGALTKLISEADGLQHLEDVITHSGGVRALSRELGVTPSYISQMRKGSHKITGKVAERLGLKRVYAYELTLIKDGPKQEQYVNKRLDYQRSVGIDPFSKKGIR